MESLSRRSTLDVPSVFAQFIGTLILVKAAAGFLAGYGLLQREAWARILGLILGFCLSSMCRWIPRWGLHFLGIVARNIRPGIPGACEGCVETPCSLQESGARR